MKNRKAFSLIEALVTMLVLGIVMGGLLQLAVSVNRTNTATVSNPVAQDEAVRVVNLLANEIRNSRMCTATTGCVKDSAVATAAGKEIMIYTSSAGAKRRYLLEDDSLKRFTGDATSPDQVIPNVVNLDLKYTLSTSYNATTLADISGWGSLYTAASLPQIIAARVEATVKVGGRMATYSTIVRLRNSPKKV